jgi:DNA-binding MarR family transcriptional regulator
MLSNTDRAKVDAYRLLMANVYELAAVSRRDSDPIATEHGVTVTQWHTMSVLSGGDATVPQVARRLGITRQAVQRVADQLVRSTHLRRRVNPRHDSSPVLTLTALGQQTLEQLWEASDGPRAATLQEISATQLTTASETLQDLLTTFRKTRAR